MTSIPCEEPYGGIYYYTADKIWGPWSNAKMLLPVTHEGGKTWTAYGIYASTGLWENNGQIVYFTGSNFGSSMDDYSIYWYKAEWDNSISPTSTPVQSPTPTRTPTPTNTPTPSRTPTPVKSPTPSPSRTPTPVKSPTPTRTPTMAPTPTPGGSLTSYEAESGSNTFNGAVVVSACSTCSGGSKVGYVGGGATNWFRFNSVWVPSTGNYTITLYYINGETVNRSVTITPNSGTSGVSVSFPPTGSWSTLGTTNATIPLTRGANTLTFSNSSGYAPDFDRIVIVGGGKPGDATGEGRVDGQDFTIWASNYNQAKDGPANGNFDFTGLVDGKDFIIWAEYYNR